MSSKPFADANGALINRLSDPETPASVLFSYAANWRVDEVVQEVATQAIGAGKFLTDAFQLGAQVFDRMDAVVEVSTEDDQNFRKNLVTILAEERLALAVYRPEAFVKGDFAAAATAATAA